MDTYILLEPKALHTLPFQPLTILIIEMRTPHAIIRTVPSIPRCLECNSVSLWWRTPRESTLHVTAIKPQGIQPNQCSAINFAITGYTNMYTCTVSEYCITLHINYIRILQYITHILHQNLHHMTNTLHHLLTYVLTHAAQLMCMMWHSSCA